MRLFSLAFHPASKRTVKPASDVESAECHMSAYGRGCDNKVMPQEDQRLHIRSNTAEFRRHWRLQVIRGGRGLHVRIESVGPSTLARLSVPSG